MTTRDQLIFAKHYEQEITNLRQEITKHCDTESYDVKTALEKLREAELLLFAAHWPRTQ